ncbi:MAG: hypothetical protein JW778_05650 [Candidatus Altiarchaeota archaeon]|nr:hypothetical protein [Candidatus Altiarchaeota archaeon]
MKITAVLKTESKDAGNVAAALDADNVSLPELRIRTEKEKDKVLTRVESNSINTLINTLDDLICCQMMAEKIVR